MKSAVCPDLGPVAGGRAPEWYECVVTNIRNVFHLPRHAQSLYKGVIPLQADQSATFMGESLGIGRGIAGERDAAWSVPWFPVYLELGSARFPGPGAALMASPVVYRRRTVETAERRPKGHGRSRSRRARRRQLWARSGYSAVAVLVLVVAACASLLTSLYLLSLVNY